MSDDVELRLKIEKSDRTGRFVRGFASVVSMDGEPVVDWQDDVIEIDTLREAVHDFMATGRVSKAMHDGEQTGEVVESLIVDDEVAKILGISDKRRGWWVGVRVDDPAVQAKVRSGELKSFSIGGSGVREEI